MSTQRVQNVTIVGGGTAGWMVAASLVRTYGKSVKFTLVESSQIGTIGVGEATIPTIRRFYASLGMSDLEVMQATQATCKLGIQFRDWHKKGASFIHPFGLFGESIHAIPFHHFWLKSRELGDQSDISEYSFGVQLAQAEKFFSPDGNNARGLAVFDWALHLDATLFAQHLRQYAEKNGVKRIDAKIIDVSLDESSGFIKSLTLDTENEVEHSIGGDLFIDCSGMQGLLIDKALGVAYEDWSNWLPCDRAVAVQSSGDGQLPPYTVAQAHSAGWRWEIPLQERNGNGHVYSSEFMSDDEATAILMQNIKGDALTDPRPIKYKAGRRKQAWHKNCIAVGLSAGFLEPLESTSIALIETAIEKIKLLFPDAQMRQGCIDEFNDMTRLEYERVRDFLILHYCKTSRDDSALWNYCRNMAIPDSLSHKIKLYRQRGHLVKYRWEIFQLPSWIAIYSGYGIYPEVVDPAVANYSNKFILDNLGAMKNAISQSVEKVPSHKQFIERYFPKSTTKNEASPHG